MSEMTSSSRRHPPSVAELTTLLEPRLPSILDLAARLTEIESGSFVPAGVDRVSDLVAERLEALGLHLDVALRSRRTGPGVRGHPDDRSTPDSVCSCSATPTRCGPEGSTADWPVVTDAPVMSGPGLGDMKCALAMAVHAIEVALETSAPGVDVDHLRSGAGRGTRQRRQSRLAARTSGDARTCAWRWRPVWPTVE